MAKFNVNEFDKAMNGSIIRHQHRAEHSDTAEDRLAAKLAVAVLSSLSLAISDAFSPPVKAVEKAKVEKKRRGRRPKWMDETRVKLLDLLNELYMRGKSPFTLETNLQPWYSEASRMKRSIKQEFGVTVPIPEIRKCATVDILASIINNHLEAKANGV